MACRSRCSRPRTAAASSSGCRRPQPATALAMVLASFAGAAGPSLDPVSDFQQLTAFPFIVNALEAGPVVAVMDARGGSVFVLGGGSSSRPTPSPTALSGTPPAGPIVLPAGRRVLRL